MTAATVEASQAASGVATQSLSKQFDAAMLDIYRRAKSEAGYTATIFINMLEERGGLKTAKYLINSTKPSDGYTQLFERGRLDLTVEAMVIESPRWHPLFDDDELNRARSRLEQHGYKLKAPPKLLPIQEENEMPVVRSEVGGQRGKIGDILGPNVKVWAHPVWGAIGKRDRVRAFGKEKVARRLEAEAQSDKDLILSIGVGTAKRNLPSALTGRILDISTFVAKVMRTEDIIGREQYQQWMASLTDDGGTRWPWGMPVVRAWRLVSPPSADEILPGLRKERFVYHHPEQMTTLLSPEEIDRLRDLAIEEVRFEVSIVDESGLAAQKQATERVRWWAAKLAQGVASRCRGSRVGYVVLRPGLETNESDLHLLLGKIIQNQKERCALCGGLLDLSSAPNRLAQPSADRIDSSVRVYDRSNLQVTHMACNLGKNDCPNTEAVDFFQTWCGEGLSDQP